MARRSLATSVVVTFSLAELACTSTGSGEHRNPPPQLIEEEELISRNPPDPSDAILEPADDGGLPVADEGGNEPPTSEVTIEQRADGTCVEVVNVRCPQGVMCNPPEPRVVPCPPDDAEKADGGGKDPDDRTSTKMVRRDDGTCWEHDLDFKCPPPGQGTCNPPRPRQVDCPDEQLPEAEDPARVVQRANGECWESFSASCPPGTRCNPPPPRKVRCPDAPGVAN